MSDIDRLTKDMAEMKLIMSHMMGSMISIRGALLQTILSLPEEHKIKALEELRESNEPLNEAIAGFKRMGPR